MRSRIRQLSHPLPNHPCAPPAQTLRRKRTKGAQQNILRCAPFCIGSVASLRCVWCGVKCCQYAIVAITNAVNCQFATPPLLEIANVKPATLSHWQHSQPPALRPIKIKISRKSLYNATKFHTLLEVSPQKFPEVPISAKTSNANTPSAPVLITFAHAPKT